MTPSLSPVRFLHRKSPPHAVTLVLLIALSALTMNLFLPSLPHMATYFGADYSVMQLAVSLYLLASAVVQLVIGPISDRYGRRMILLWAVALYVLATLGAMLAQEVHVFLLFRMLQSVVAATMVLSRAIVRDMYDTDEAASVMGYVTMGMAIVPMLGPTVGGFLDQAFGWQASFGFMLACGLGIFTLTWADLGETTSTRPTSLRAQFEEYPQLLTSRRFWGYCLTSAFASGVFFAYLGGAPYIGSVFFHLPPSVLGLYFGAPALGYAVGNFISGRYSRRFGVNRMVIMGTACTVLGLGTLTAFYLFGLVHPAIFFGFFTTVGLGNGLVLPNASAGMLSVRPKLAGTASGLGGTIMIGGGAALSALAGAVLTPDSGPLPLLAVMIASSIASVFSILWVIVRERQLTV